MNNLHKYSDNVISKCTAEKKLKIGKRSISGRDNSGRISVRFRGGGHKRCFRIIDFLRKKSNVPAKVISIEYDPNRSALIALLYYIDGDRKYIICPKLTKIGQILESGSSAKIEVGNSLPLYNIPLGAVIHNIEIRPGKGAQLARSAGTNAVLLSKEENYAYIKLPSNETRKIFLKCFATIGQISNVCHNLKNYVKAGKKRWLGRRPHNRGVSMNPVDHPLGGGEGKSSGGRHPSSPWGKPTKGLKTRNNKRTNKMIINKKKK